MKSIAIALALSLGGCGAFVPIAAKVLMYGGPAATILKDVVDVDISLRQDKPDKIKIVPPGDAVPPAN
jgi:hypothetical protein